MDFNRISFKYNPDFPDCVTVVETAYDNLTSKLITLTAYEIQKLQEFSLDNGVLKSG